MDWLLQDIMHKYGLTLQPKCCNSTMCYGKCKNKNTRTHRHEGESTLHQVEKINWPLVEAIKAIFESSSTRMNDVVGTDDEDGTATADNSMMTDDVAEYVDVGSDSIHVSFDAIDVEACRGDSNDDIIAIDVGMASEDDESGAPSSVLDNNFGTISETPHPPSLPKTPTSTLSVAATTKTLSLDAINVESCRGDSNGDMIANDVGSTTMAPEWTSTNATDAPVVHQPRGEQNSHPNINNGKTNQNRKKKASPKNQPAQSEALTWSLLLQHGKGGKREQALVAIKTRFNLALGGTRIDTNEGKELLELLRFRKELVSKGSAEGVSIPPQYATHYTQLEKLRKERDGITSSGDDAKDAKQKKNTLSQKISRSSKKEDARICKLAVQYIENGLSDNEEGTALAALLQEDYEKCKSKTTASRLKNASMCKRYGDKIREEAAAAQARLDEFEANSNKSLPGYSEKLDELAKEAEEWKSKTYASVAKRSRDKIREEAAAAQARLDEFEANSNKCLPGYSEKLDELAKEAEEWKSKTTASVAKRSRDKIREEAAAAQARLDEFEANSNKCLPGYSEKLDELAKEAEEWKSRTSASVAKRFRDNVVVYQDNTGTVIRRRDIFPSRLDLNNALASLTPVSGSSPSEHSRKKTRVYLDGYAKQKPCETAESMKKIR
eukprot:scaffold6017_cov77-Skeletonema_dohrnii-CCMP3373.AAC.6